MNRFRVVGIVNGKEQALPDGLEALMIQTPSGQIYIDLEVEGRGGVIVRSVSDERGRPEIIVSPLSAGQLLLGVAHGKE